MNAQEIRESVALYRGAYTSTGVRSAILREWQKNGIPNQFAAMLRAAELKSCNR